MSEPVLSFRASFDAARSEQLRLPGEEALKRRDWAAPQLVSALTNSYI